MTGDFLPKPDVEEGLWWPEPEEAVLGVRG